MLQMNGATLRNQIEQRLSVELFQFREAHATARPYRREASSQGRTKSSPVDEPDSACSLAIWRANLSEAFSLPQQRPAARCDRRSAVENVAQGRRQFARSRAR